MEKLSGGTELDCGHMQVISDLRQSLASARIPQHRIYCIECDDWTQLKEEDDTSVSDSSDTEVQGEGSPPEER